MKRDSEWVNALEHGHGCFKAIEGLCGSGDDQFVHTGLLELRHEMAHFIRRLNNLALLHGVNPTAVERVKEMAA